MVREREERKGKYIIHFHSKETKNGDFTRMARKNKVHFPCVKMRRKKVTKKRGKHKEKKWRE